VKSARGISAHETEETQDMGGRLSVIAKGRLLRLVDDNLQAPTAAFLDELTRGDSMVALGLAKQILKPGQEGHVNDEIFGDAGNANAWWPNEAEKEKIVRGGFIRALTVALGHSPPVPIECYWVAGAPHFEIIVSDCVGQVNVFLLTPEPGKVLNPAQTGVMEDMWVVATDARCAELRKAIPDNYGPEDPQPIPSLTDVKSLRLWGY
jgi:hypothetical protein